MTDEMDRLKRALDATRPEPDQAVRRRALDAALRTFDEENSRESLAATQGSAAGERQSKGRASPLARLFGGLSMNIPMPSLKPALMGGASLAVIAIAVLATRDLPRKIEIAPPATPVEQTIEIDKSAVAEGDEVLQSAPATSVLEREVSISIDAVSGVAGFVAAGDRVDILLTRTQQGQLVSSVILQDITIIAVDQSANSETTRARLGSTVTVEVNTVQAQKLALARQVGKLSLTLRGIGETSDEVLRPVTVGDLSDFERPEEAPEFKIRVRRGGKSVAMNRAPMVIGQTEQLQISVAPSFDEPMPPGYQDQGRDNFAEIDPNPVKVTAEEPVSTFSIDVDTASYSFMRKALMRGVLPQKDSVRIEEMINYFPYAYQGPSSRETPFRANVQIIPTPWNPETRLLRIGIKGYALTEGEKPRANLVFLIDTSGSMNAPDKLPLLINSFRLLIDALDPDDTVAIVTYAGSAGTVLEPTRVAEAGKILAALEHLHAGGSTAGAEGIRQAYRLAERNFDPDGVNRVILATDGDFNVGITDMDELQGFVERKRESGVLLSVLGFGHGNLNDALMQTLAQNGNGQAIYIDTLNEARKALVEEAGSTLFPIAKDVKIQIEFNPATVAEYRLIGYETRLLAREDFNNDAVDAGEIGSGHTVTALYEITPVGSAARLVDDLRYRGAAEVEANTEEYGYLKIRYKAPGGDVSTLIETPVTRAAEIDPDDARALETRFAAAVAGFGQLLRGGRHMGDFSYDDVVALAVGAKGDDPFGYRAEFVNLVRLAKSAAALEPLRR